MTKHGSICYHKFWALKLLVLSIYNSLSSIRILTWFNGESLYESDMSVPYHRIRSQLQKWWQSSGIMCAYIIAHEGLVFCYIVTHIQNINYLATPKIIGLPRFLILLPCLVQGSIFRCIVALFKSGGVHDRLHIYPLQVWNLLPPLA